jgi:hypothetical protein
MERRRSELDPRIAELAENSGGNPSGRAG